MFDAQSIRLERFLVECRTAARTNTEFAPQREVVESKGTRFEKFEVNSADLTDIERIPVKN